MPSADTAITAVAPRQLPAEVLAAAEAAVQRLGSQVALAEQIGISASALNQAMKGKYRGDLGRIEQRIRGVLLNLTVQCPVLAQLSKKDCLDEQRRPLVFSNPLRVRLHRACKTCPHRQQSTPKGAP